MRKLPTVLVEKQRDRDTPRARAVTSRGPRTSLNRRQVYRPSSHAFATVDGRTTSHLSRQSTHRAEAQPRSNCAEIISSPSSWAGVVSRVRTGRASSVSARWTRTGGIWCTAYFVPPMFVFALTETNAPFLPSYCCIRGVYPRRNKAKVQEE